MTNKMTQRDYFNEIIALAQSANREDIVEFAEGRIAALDKKAANKKPTKAQEEGTAIKADILAALTSEGQTVSELLKNESLAGLSNQRVSALLRQLIDTGEVVKTSDKKRSLFSLAQ